MISTIQTDLFHNKKLIINPIEMFEIQEIQVLNILL